MKHTKLYAIWSASARRGKGSTAGQAPAELRHGRRQPTGMKPWTKKHLEWVKSQVHFDQPASLLADDGHPDGGRSATSSPRKALKAALGDYFHEVEHAAARIERLEKALDEAIRQAPEQIRAVIEVLQSLGAVAQLTAATIVSEIGSFSRFTPRKLRGYGGLVASEHTSGHRVQRGSITKTGDAHLRRVIVEAALAYQRRPWISGYLLRRQRDLKFIEEITSRCRLVFAQRGGCHSIFHITHAVVKDFPDQSAKAVGDGPDRLWMYPKREAKRRKTIWS